MVFWVLRYGRKRPVLCACICSRYRETWDITNTIDRPLVGGQNTRNRGESLPLHGHSRGYKCRFQKSRVPKKEAHIFVNSSWKGFSVDFENAIKAWWIHAINYLLHAGIIEVFGWFGTSWNEQWCVYVYLLERQKNGSDIVAAMAFLHTRVFLI